MLKAVIFDFDGVLFDSEIIHYQAYSKIFAQHGFSIPYRTYVNNYLGLPDVEIIRQALSERNINIDDSQLNVFIESKIEHYRRVIAELDNLVCVKDLASFLTTLNTHTDKIAICSNSQRLELESALAKLEYGSLNRYFKTITTINDVTQGKPSPEGYIMTAEKLNVLPTECLVIEDSRNGIRAAKAANMTVAAITSTHEPEALSQADYIIENYHDIKLNNLFNR